MAKNNNNYSFFFFFRNMIINIFSCNRSDPTVSEFEVHRVPNNQGFLTGIESNPGPSSPRRLFSANEAILDMLNKPLGPRPSDTFFVRMISFFETLTPTEYCNQILDDSAFRSKESVIINIPIEVIKHFAIRYKENKLFITPQARRAAANNIGLIGIETNPGPVNSIPIPFEEGLELQGLFDYIMPKLVIEASPELTSTVASVTEAVNQLSQRQSLGIDLNLPGSKSLGKIFDSVRELYEDNKIMFYIVGGVVVIYLVYKSVDAIPLRKQYSIPIVAIVVGLIAHKLDGFSNIRQHVQEIFNLILAYFDKTSNIPHNDLEPQSISSDTIAIGLSSALFKLFSPTSTESMANKFLKMIGDLPKLSAGISHLIEFILSICKQIYVWFCSAASIEPSLISASMFPELDGATKEFNEFIVALRDGMDYNYDSAQRLFAIEQRVSNVIAKIPNSRDFIEYKKSALSLKSQIKPYISRMERNNIVNNGPRREPLGIMIGGPTGAGKSTSMVPILLAVMARIMPKDKLESFKQNHNDHIWNFIPENPFFDSYHGQFAVTADENGQALDVAGNPSPEALMLMRMINTANFPLHMANLEDKGNVNFRSELVFATTNRTFFDWKSIYLPVAYTRRFRISYVMVPKLEYCTEATKMCVDKLFDRRLDRTKIPVTTSGFSMEINEFYPYSFDPNTPGVVGKAISMVELIDLIVSEYYAIKDHGNKLLDFHKKIKSDYIDDRAADDAKCDGFEAGSQEAMLYDALADECSISKIVSYQVIKDYVCSLKDSISEFGLPSLLDCTNFNADISRFIGSSLKAIDSNSFILSLKQNKLALGILGGAGAMLCIWKIFFRNVFEPQAEYTLRSAKQSKRASKHYKKQQVGISNNLLAQGGINQNAYEICRKIAKKNLYRISYLSSQGEKITCGFGLFIRSRQMIMPEHFLFEFDRLVESGSIMGGENAMITFDRMGSLGTSFEIAVNDIHYDAIDEIEDDIAYVTFPRIVHAHPDISKFIASGDEDTMASKFSALLVRSDHESFSIVDTTALPTGSMKYHGFTCQSSFTYSIATKKGECGAPLFFVSPTGSVKVCGMHVAGNNISGVSLRLHHDRIKTVFDRDTADHVQVELDLEAQGGCDMGPKFLVQGEVSKHRTMLQSCVIKSPFYGLWSQPRETQGPLKGFTRDGVYIDPWAISRRKYSPGSRYIPLGMLRVVTDHTISEMMYASTERAPWAPRIFSFEESIQGIPNVPYVDSISRNTSPGYPYSLHTKGKGKTDWFGEGPEFDLTTDKSIELREHIMHCAEQLKQGVRMKCLYSDNLKDARIPIAKALAGKTRLFSAAPLDAYILFKMYYGDFIRWLMTNRINNGTAMGINPYAEEWTALAEHLTSVGSKCIFGDYSGYDGSLYATIQYAFLDVVEAYYHNSSLEDRVARATLFEEIVNSMHVARHSTRDDVSVVYEWFGSNPSGNLLTTALNSICGIFIVKLGVIKCFLDYKSAPFSDSSMNYILECVCSMSDHLRVITFGDDNGICVSDDYATFVNQQLLTDALALIGFVYTDEAKGDAQHTFRSLDECSFLKRGFKFNRGKYDAPLSLDVILEMGYWTRKNVPCDSLPNTLETAIMELSLHGNDCFHRYAPTICRAAAEKLSHHISVDFKTQYYKAKHMESMY